MQEGYPSTHLEGGRGGLIGEGAFGRDVGEGCRGGTSGRDVGEANTGRVVGDGGGGSGDSLPGGSCQACWRSDGTTGRHS